MERQKLQSITSKKFKTGKLDKRLVKKYQNLLKQDFSIPGLNQKWVADITYINTLEDGWCYLLTIMALHSRKIIGDHFDQQRTTEIVKKALNYAVLNRTIEDG